MSRGNNVKSDSAPLGKTLCCYHFTSHLAMTCCAHFVVLPSGTPCSCNSTWHSFRSDRSFSHSCSLDKLAHLGDELPGLCQLGAEKCICIIRMMNSFFIYLSEILQCSSYSSYSSCFFGGEPAAAVAAATCLAGAETRSAKGGASACGAWRQFLILRCSDGANSHRTCPKSTSTSTGTPQR